MWLNPGGESDYTLAFFLASSPIPCPAMVDELPAENDDKYPPSEDTYWLDACRPLEEFMRTGEKRWSEILHWAKTNGIGHSEAREMVAWLSLQNRAFSKRVGADTIWFCA